MQVPQVAAGHLPERKQSVTMMQVQYIDPRLPDLASVLLKYSLQLYLLTCSRR